MDQRGHDNIYYRMITGNERLHEETDGNIANYPPLTFLFYSLSTYILTISQLCKEDSHVKRT